MLEKPNLADEIIIAHLEKHHDFSITNLEFLPIGYDATAWVYRVESEKICYFLKLKKGDLYESALFVPRYLYDKGLQQVVAPLPTQSGTSAISVDDFKLILYPFIEGETGMEKGLSPEQWREFGTILKQMHSLDITAELEAKVKMETFTPAWADRVRQLDEYISANKLDNPYENKLAQIWRDKHDEMMKIVHRTEELGDKLKKTPLELVLCHCDIHTANVLVSPQGELFIVDWDQPLLAPIERDLIFVCEGIIPKSEHEKQFFEGYGETKINPLAYAYYRYEWVVQELGDFGDRVFFDPNSGDETRADSVRGFLQLFDEGDVISAAYKAERIWANK